MDELRRLFALDGRVALITGASGGIGEAFAATLARAGAEVMLHGRNAAALQSVVETLRAEDRVAESITADLCDPSACQRLIDATLARFGRLDILVNCAGMNRRKPALDVTADDFDTILAVNLRSLFFLSNAAVHAMRVIGGGRIVHVASLTSFIGLGTTSVYGATKAAVAQLAKTHAVEWAKYNVQVNCLAPGFIETPLTSKSLWGDERKRRWLLDRIPARRAGAPDDLSATLLLLASPQATYLTGQTIAVDGGVLAGGSWED